MRIRNVTYGLRSLPSGVVVPVTLSDGLSLMDAIVVAGADENPNANYSLTGVQQPPHDGETYDYNDFQPGAAGFIEVGETFECPVFGSVIMRMTDSEGSVLGNENYAKHQINADGTMMYSESVSSGMVILDTSDASVLYTNQPVGLAQFEVHWDAVDPNIYYYLSGTSLMQRNISAQTSSTKKNFGSTLQTNGGSLNIQSADGRYFTVRWGGTNKVWDSVDDVVYSGSVTPPGGGWVSLTPSGNHICAGGNSHYSYPLDHDANSIGSQNEYWNLCGDHAVLISPGDGNDYAVVVECNSYNGIYLMDVTTDVSGMSVAQQEAAATQLLSFGSQWTVDVHMSAVSSGPYKHFVFIDTEELGGGDNFDVDPGGSWYQYESEIIAVNVLTQDVYRLCHHRSRNITGNEAYAAQPRVSCGWTGTKVIWGSNFNNNATTNYADYYLMSGVLASAVA